jgi:hypothetical protein
MDKIEHDPGLRRERAVSNPTQDDVVERMNRRYAHLKHQSTKGRDSLLFELESASATGEPLRVAERYAQGENKFAPHGDGVRRASSRSTSN